MVGDDDEITASIEVTAPREQVWRALTDPDLAREWLAALRFGARPGATFYLQPLRDRRERDQIEDSLACIINAVDPPRRLGFTFRAPDLHDTYVDLRLRRIPGGTHVRLTHWGWGQFEPEEVDRIKDGLQLAWRDGALPNLRRVAEGLG